MIISPYNCHITINGTGMKGVNTASIEAENALAPVSFLGMDFFDQIQNGEVIPEFTFARKDYETGIDPIRALTGDIDCSGELIYKGLSGYEKIYFTGGYLTAYNATFSLDSPPTYSYSFSIYGDLGKVTGVSTPAAFNPTLISPERNTINLTSSRFSGFIVDDISYGITIDRSPVYSLRSKGYAAVKRIKPLTMSLQVGYHAKELTDSLFDSMQRGALLPKDTISLVVKNEAGNVKDSFSGVMRIKSDTISVSTENEIKLSSSYSALIPNTIF